MSLDVMTTAVGKVLNQANRGMSLIQVSQEILMELASLGYQVKPTIDTGLSPMKQGATELHEIYSTLKEQGFTDEQAFALTEIIFTENLDRFRDKE